MTFATMLVFHSTSRVYLAPSMFVHALIRVSVLGVVLPTSSAFISVEVTNLHGEAWCCLSLHVRLAWGGTESVDVLVFRFVFPLFPAFVVSAVIAVITVAVFVVLFLERNTRRMGVSMP